jgi:hypothetical protein
VATLPAASYPQPTTKKEEKMDIVNLYSTTMIDGGEIRKCYVSVLYPPASFPGGIPKIIVSDTELSEKEINDTTVEMAKQNARLLVELAQVAFAPGGGKTGWQQ